MRLGSIVLDAADAAALADFYARLLGWEKRMNPHEGEEWWVVEGGKGAGTPLVFQQEPDYVPPAWPAEAGRQQQMMHLDFYVRQREMEQATAHALACGATRATVQLSDDWCVFLDPAGHPFCIIPLPMGGA